MRAAWSRASVPAFPAASRIACPACSWRRRARATAAGTGSGRAAAPAVRGRRAAATREPMAATRFAAACRATSRRPRSTRRPRRRTTGSSARRSDGSAAARRATRSACRTSSSRTGPSRRRRRRRSRRASRAGAPSSRTRHVASASPSRRVATRRSWIGLGIVAGAHAPRRLGERRGQAFHFGVEARGERVGGHGGGRYGGGIAPSVSWEVRTSRRSTRADRSSAVSSTGRVASSVSKPYSLDSRSSSSITRLW